MKDKMENIYYIEYLTVGSWLFRILPYFLQDQQRALKRIEKIYYFNRSYLGLRLAKFTLWPRKIRLEQVKFSQASIRDKDGHLIWMRTLEGALSIERDFQNNSAMDRVAAHYEKAYRIRSFLSSCMISCGGVATNKSSLLNLVFLMDVIDCLTISNKPPRPFVCFFMRERPELNEAKQFAVKKGIHVVSAGAQHFYINKFFSQLRGMKSFIKQVIYYWMIIKYKINRIICFKRRNLENRIENYETTIERQPSERIVVEYYGHLNINSSELVSDLFFVPESSLSPKDILISCGLPRAPIKDEEWKEIRRNGMSAVAINPLAASTPDIPVFKHKESLNGRWRSVDCLRDEKQTFLQQWLYHYIKDYYQRYDYWIDFIIKHNIKIHVAWPKHDPGHSVLLDALQNTGGIGVVYQRSFQHSPTPWTFTTADVFFGFSKLDSLKGENDKRSTNLYYITVGYIGDCRFNHLKEQSNNIRNSLRSRGAQKIMAYFDEHAKNNPPWDLGYKSSIEQYSFLLNKVLENPWFGLILKPKVPATLRSRLGAVSELLEAAQRTGRCFIFERGVLHGSHPPAVAALAADVAVHGHLFAATAGVESALAGIPTLFLDYEGVPRSPLFRLGECVIFRDIDNLWKVCREHWDTPAGIPGFANWSSMLDEMDPFRDGRAAQRMGTYLEWLLEGFKAKLPRETVLADAADRYGKMWGRDKILFAKSHQPEENLSQSCLMADT